MAYKVECEWRNKQKVVVNPDGQVWPCCYLCNPTYKHSVVVGHMLEKNDVWLKYLANAEKYNVFNRPLSEIMREEWFTETLPESWEKEETSLQACKHWCSNRINNNT